MKKLLALVIAVVLVFAAMPVMAETASEGKTLTIAMGTKPNLDLHWNAGSTGSTLMELMYEGLYEMTDTAIVLAGATSREVSDDGLTWTYHLRTDAVWSDGKPVTANDYVYSMRRLVNPAVSSTYMLDYGQYLKNGSKISAGELPVEDLGVYAADDYTLVIELEDVCSYFECILTYTAFFPLREDCVSEDGTGNWAWDVSRSITNGKMIMTYCDEEQQIVLEKNPLYHDADKVLIDKLVVKLVDDSNTTLQLFKNGEVDMIDTFPSEETESLQEAGYFHAEPSLYTRFLLINNNEEGLNDSRVRKALSLVIDREFLTDVILLGNYIPATTYVGSGFQGGTEGLDFKAEGGDLISSTCTEEDIALAQQLMAEAGYPNGEGFPVIECSYDSSSADYATMFEYLQSCWEENLGITVTLNPLEKATMTTLRDAGDFDITPQGWGPDWLDASNMLSIFVTGNFINAGRYSSEAFDTYYNDSMRTFDTAERISLLHKAEYELIANDMGTIPIYHRKAVAIYDDAKLENVKFNVNRKVMYDQVIVK